MNKSRISSQHQKKQRWFQTALRWGLIGLCVTAIGCEHFIDERYFKGTKSVPEERFQRVEPLDLPSLSVDPKPREPNEVPPAHLPLTIEECRALALENNLDLKVQLFSPRKAEENVKEARAAFEPSLFSRFNFSKTDTPAGSPITFTLDAFQTEYINGDLGFQIPLHAGGTVTLDFPFSRSLREEAVPILDDEGNVIDYVSKEASIYGTNFAISVDQPLLRGGGLMTNTHAIRVAYYGSLIAKARTKLEVIRVLAAVDRVYWRLYAARRELDVRKQEFDLAKQQLESTRRKVAAGDTAEIEILRAEDAAAQRMEAIILADNAVRDRERELKLVLNKAGLGMETPTIIDSATEPKPQYVKLDSERIIEYALENRMELLELELQIASDDSVIEYEKNGLLPVLNLNYTYNINGLGQQLNDAYDLMLRNRFVDHRIGLVLQVPLGNRAARSRWRRALLQRRERLASKRQREALIKREVLNAADQLEANWQRVIASRQSSILAERTLKAEQRQYDLGMQILREVLDAQARYANAQSAQIQALVEYQIAQVDLAYATGGLLGAAQIYWFGEAQEKKE